MCYYALCCGLVYYVVMRCSGGEEKTSSHTHTQDEIYVEISTWRENHEPTQGCDVIYHWKNDYKSLVLPNMSSSGCIALHIWYEKFSMKQSGIQESQWTSLLDEEMISQCSSNSSLKFLSNWFLILNLERIYMKGYLLHMEPYSSNDGIKERASSLFYSNKASGPSETLD